MNMVSLFGEYQQFVTLDDEDMIFFNSEKFVSNKKNNKNFFLELSDTQNFNYFVQQDCQEAFPFFYKLLTKNDLNFSKQDLEEPSKEESFIIKPYFITENLTECNSIEEYLYDKLHSKKNFIIKIDNLGTSHLINEQTRVINHLKDINNSATYNQNNKKPISYYRYLFPKIFEKETKTSKVDVLSKLQMFEKKVQENSVVKEKEKKVQFKPNLNTNSTKMQTTKQDKDNNTSEQSSTSPSTSNIIIEHDIDLLLEQTQRRGK